MRVIQVLVVLLGGWAASSQAAELVVISSDDPSIEAGTVIDGSRSLSVSPEALIVLVSSDGRTITLSGPYNGAPDVSSSRSDGRLVDSLSRLITREANSPTTLAVFRSGLNKAPTGRPDLWGIDSGGGNGRAGKDPPGGRPVDIGLSGALRGQ